jgi:hypothetical protein
MDVSTVPSRYSLTGQSAAPTQAFRVKERLPDQPSADNKAVDGTGRAARRQASDLPTMPDGSNPPVGAGRQWAAQGLGVVRDYIPGHPHLYTLLHGLQWVLDPRILTHDLEIYQIMARDYKNAAENIAKLLSPKR